MNERDYLLSLNAVKGIGNARIRKLIHRFGSAKKIFSLKARDFLTDQIISKKVSEQILSFDYNRYLKEEYDLLKKHRAHVLTFLDKDYPESLKVIDDAPAVIYVKGFVPKNMEMSLAIVGSRRASFYGISMAEKFAVRFAELGIVVISGMARGIDTAAHRGALKAKGVTVAVLGCGLSRVYPPENKSLMEHMIDQGGAVFSEFAMKEPPLAAHFPKRNRIISGLSLGVIVVEAAQRSGALITADCALEQGKEVFAVPGKVDAPNSRGVHSLIQQGAKLVSNVEDILEEIKPHLKTSLQKKDFQKSSKRSFDPQGSLVLSEEERRVYQHIDHHKIHVDQIMHSCDVPVDALMAILLRLELKHCIKQLPGKMFQRVSASTSY